MTEDIAMVRPQESETTCACPQHRGPSDACPPHRGGVAMAWVWILVALCCVLCLALCAVLCPRLPSGSRTGDAEVAEPGLAGQSTSTNPGGGNAGHNLLPPKGGPGAAAPQEGGEERDRLMGEHEGGEEGYQTPHV